MARPKGKTTMWNSHLIVYKRYRLILACGHFLIERLPRLMDAPRHFAEKTYHCPDCQYHMYVASIEDLGEEENASSD